jgi:hypothetical protein
MKHYRTSFPSNVNFDGWFIKSKKGCIAQLVQNGRNLHEHNLYTLRHANGQTGSGLFTMEMLVECCVSIRFHKEDLNDKIPQPAKVPGPRQIVR